MKVRAQAEVTAVEGRRITFAVSAFDGRERIGGGVHQRFIARADCTAFTAAPSIRATIRGVASTGARPEPMAWAVSWAIQSERFLAKAQGKLEG